MANYNKVIMMGNLTRDPEYKQLPSGQAICKLGLACNRQFKNRQTDAMIQEVCFVDIDVWGQQAQACQQYLQKGRAVLVEGRLKFDTWQDNNGQTRSKHSIVADRVLFLSAAQSDVADTVTEPKAKPNKSQVDPALEKELLDKIDQIKEKASSSVSEKKSTAEKSEVKPAAKVEPAEKPAVAPQKKSEEEPAEGVAFKDEPPFQDDLPF